jgi:hypothetical protein
MGPRALAANRGSAMTTRPRGVLLGPPRARRTTTSRAHHNADANDAPPPPSTARRLLAAALLDPLHDLSVDFDRTYLAHRCGQSVPLFAEGCDEGDVVASATSGEAAAPSDGTPTATADARLDRCLLLQREYGSALGRLLTANEQGSASPSAAALDAAVLLAAFVLSADGGDEGDTPDLLLREAREAVEFLSKRALSIARGDRSARGLSAAVSEAIFGVGGEAAVAPSSSPSSAAADRCFYHPSNSCALTVLRRIVARHTGDAGGGLDRRRSKSRPGSPPHQQQQQQSLGSPATLALVWSAVASRAGLPSAPLPLPSHTFVRLWAPGASESNSSSLPWVVDPYNSGQVCTAGVVSARLGRNWGGVALGGAGGEEEEEGGRVAQHHQRTLHALCLVRLLCNLRESSWAPLPLTGRVRWRAVRGGEGGSGGSGGSGKRSNSSRRTLWPAVASSHDALAARLAVRARRGWMGGAAGGGAASPPPPPLAPLAARCVRAVRLLRATLREMVVEGSQHQRQQLEAALPRLDRDEGYALCLGGMPSQGKEALAAYLAARPQAPDAAACAEFL